MNYESWGITIKCLQNILCTAATLPTVPIPSTVTCNICSFVQLWWTGRRSWKWSRLLCKYQFQLFNLYSPLFYGYCVTTIYWSLRKELLAHLSLKNGGLLVQEYTNFLTSNPLIDFKIDFKAVPKLEVSWNDRIWRKKRSLKFNTYLHNAGHSLYNQRMNEACSLTNTSKFPCNFPRPFHAGIWHLITCV